MRRWRGLTWMGWVNYLVLRWFFVRLHRVVEDDGEITGYGLRRCFSWRWGA